MPQKNNLKFLQNKIINEYDTLYTYLKAAAANNALSPDELLEYSEYFFVKFRIYICFKDFSGYMQQMDDKIISFLLKLKNASDYLAMTYENGLAGDCDIKSVEGIEKLMIFSYNNALYKTGRFDFSPVDALF